MFGLQMASKIQTKNQGFGCKKCLRTDQLNTQALRTEQLSVRLLDESGVWGIGFQIPTVHQRSDSALVVKI